MSRLNGHVYSMTRGTGVHDPLTPVVYQQPHRVLIDSISSKRVFEVTRVSKRNSESDELVNGYSKQSAAGDVHHSLYIPSSTENLMSTSDSNPNSSTVEQQRSKPLADIICNDIRNSPSEVQSRFRIVKIESRDLFKRGRWTCRDFADPPEAKSAEVKLSLKSGSSTAAKPVFYVPGASDDPASSQLIFYSEGHPVLDSDSLPCSSKLLLGELTTSVTVSDGGLSSLSEYHVSASHSSGDRRQHSTDGAGSDNASERTVGAGGSARVSDVDGEEWMEKSKPTSLLSLAIDENTEHSLASGGSTSEIDNKIEQAMDLVKAHLMMAVRAEVEELKEQIEELVLKNSQLAFENSILRANADPELLQSLDNPASDSEYNCV